MSQNACVSFPNSEQNTTLKESMINRLSNLINRNRSSAKISQVLCSSWNSLSYNYNSDCDDDCVGSILPWQTVEDDGGQHYDYDQLFSERSDWLQDNDQ